MVNELSATLGGPQNIIGPVLVIPYTQSTVVEERFGDAQGVMQLRERVTVREREFLVLPDQLALDLSGEHRRRGIYRVLATATVCARVAATRRPPSRRLLRTRRTPFTGAAHLWRSA